MARLGYDHYYSNIVEEDKRRATTQDVPQPQTGVSPIYYPADPKPGKNGKKLTTLKRRRNSTGDQISKQVGFKDEPDSGPARSKIGEDQQRALEVSLNFGLQVLADQEVPRIDIAAIQRAVYTTNRPPVPLENPTALQERMWNWSLRQVRHAATSEVQSTEENTFLLQDINNQNRYMEVTQLLSAMRSSESTQALGIQILAVQCLVTGMAMNMETNLELHTGAEYLDRLVTYFSRIVRRRRAIDSRLGRSFTIGDDFCAADLRYGTFTPLQVDVRTFENLTVTEVTRDPDPDLGEDRREMIPGWFTDDTLHTLLRSLLPNARETQRTYIIPPAVWTPLQRHAEAEGPESDRRQAANEYIDTAAVAPPRDHAGNFPWRGNIVIPNNYGGHWSLVYIRHDSQNPDRPQIFYMDSQRSANNRRQTQWALQRWFEHPALRGYFGNNFNFEYMGLESQQQFNTWDCGVFALENAIHLDRGNDNAPFVEAAARRTAIGAMLFQAIQELGNQLPSREDVEYPRERRILSSPRETREVMARTKHIVRSSSGSVLLQDADH